MQARRHYLWPFFLIGASFGLAGCHQANLIDSPMFLPGQQPADKKTALTSPDGIQQTSATEIGPKKVNTGWSSPPIPSPGILKRLTLGPLTGGFDSDNQPGDEVLLIELQTRDSADKIVPVIGNLQITALQLSPDGTKPIVGVWNIKAGELQTQWKLDQGYFLMLPWRSWPVYEQIRVVARITVQSGKTYEVVKDVQVHLPVARPPPPLPPGASSQGPLEPASHQDWHAQTLGEAVRLLRPVPLRGDE